MQLTETLIKNVKFLTKWKIKVPFALSSKKWEIWREENKKKYPIRWFFQQTIPNIFHTDFTYYIRELYWNIIYRTIKKHQYHIIRPRTLKPSYCDQDIRILHGVMECFVDFFETSSHKLDWTDTEKTEQVYAEMKEIYDWWTNKRKNRDTFTIQGEKLKERPKLPKQWDIMATITPEYKSEPLVREYNKISKKYWKNQDDWEKLETEMLIRVIKIRKYMWD